MTVGIVGLGLIGGSIGLALREPGRRIIGFDPSPESIKTSNDRFCIDAAVSFEEVAQADVVFVAVPPMYATSTLEALRKVKGEQTVITDCTSVKASVTHWAVGTKEPKFVIGHPMAGHENSGATFASSWLFRGARWIVCPLPFTDKGAVKQVEALVKSMGATPIRMKPDEHDRQVATLSHLPHAIAGALVLMREELKDEDAAGGSWRDLTRVGGVDPTLWTQIFMENRIELSHALQRLEIQLADLRAGLDSNDTQAITAFLAKAQKVKRKPSAQ